MDFHLYGRYSGSWDILYFIYAYRFDDREHYPCDLLHPVRLFITYQELFLRINVPVTPREIPVESSVSSDIPVPLETLDTPDENITPEKNKENPLWLQLNELIDREQLWRNPDTNITKLAVLLDTNRNKLTQIIQEQGYDGYKEFINRRRIDEFLKIADSVNT